MTEDKISYFKEAFYTAWNYGVLGVLGLLAFFMRSPILFLYFLLFATAVELGTLYTISQNPRFRRAVRSRLNAGLELPDPLDIEKLKSYLEGDQLQSANRFADICRQIRTNAEIVESPRSALMGVSLSRLDNMIYTYFQMLLTHQNYSRYLSSVDRDRIVRQIAALEREIEARNDRVAQLKKKNREILQQRLERIDKARENIEVVEAELEVMLNTVQLLKDQTVSISDPQGISQQIDAVLENMKDAEALVQEMDSFIHQEAVLDSSPDFEEPPDVQPDKFQNEKETE